MSEIGYQSGYGLPAELLFDVERTRRVLTNRWFFIGTRADVASPGDILTIDLLGDSYLVVHGRDGSIRCFENRCLHQSAHLVNAATDHCPARLVCRNHAWSYDPDSGALLATPGVASALTSNDRFSGLAELSIAERHGLLFASLAENAATAEPDAIAAVVEPYLEPFHLTSGGYRLALHEREVVDANWLIIMINNRECVHCQVNHPGLCQVFDPSSFNGSSSEAYRKLFDGAVQRWERMGLSWQEDAFATDDAVRVARYPMKAGHRSITFDGRPACSRCIGPFEQHDESTLSIWLNPNAWLHFTSDHISTNWVLPLDAERSVLHTSWIVDERAVEGVDYDADHLADVWRVTNAEDVELCSSMTAGARSSRYAPGPFGENERWCRQFCDWIAANAA